MIDFVTTLNTDDLLIKSVFKNADGVVLSGQYGNLCQPTIAWNNGKTFVVGHLDDLTTNNSPVIFEYYNEEVSFIRVGDIDNYDALSHSFPTILIINNYIFIFQVNGHGKPIKIWKSNSENTIKSGFTLHYTLGDFFGYCLPRLLPDGRVFLLSRTTAGSTDNYGHRIAISAINDLTSWTIKTTTHPNFPLRRHYTSAPYYYGVNNWHYAAIQHRNDSSFDGEKFFAHSFYKTQDFITFYSLDELFSKNIDVDGAFTETEIDNNLTYVGSLLQKNQYRGGVNFIVIDDAIYGNCYNPNTKKFDFYKITPTGEITFTPTPFYTREPNGTWITAMFHFYNGENLIHLVNELSEWNIYVSDLDFNNIQRLYTLSDFNDQNIINRPVIPTNLEEVVGKYIIGGSAVENIFPYVTTDEKFLLRNGLNGITAKANKYIGIGVVYGSVIQLIEGESSVAIDYFKDVSINGNSYPDVKVNGYITGLDLDTTYNISGVAIDVFGNNIGVSSISQTTAATYQIDTAAIASYYKMEGNFNDTKLLTDFTTSNVLYESGNIGQRALFNGTSSYATANNNNLSFTDGTNDLEFSISFPIIFNSTADQWFLNKRSATTAGNQEYDIDYYQGKIRILLFNDTTTVNIKKEYAFTPTIGQKYNITVGYDASGTASGLFIGVDGTDGGTASTSGTYTKMALTNQPVLIGKQGWYAGGYLNAKIEEMVFWNKKISQGEISEQNSKWNSGQYLI